MPHGLRPKLAAFKPFGLCGSLVDVEMARDPLFGREFIYTPTGPTPPPPIYDRAPLIAPPHQRILTLPCSNPLLPGSTTIAFLPILLPKRIPTLCCKRIEAATLFSYINHTEHEFRTDNARPRA